MSWLKKVVKGIGKGVKAVGGFVGDVIGVGGNNNAPATPINIDLGGLLGPRPVGPMPPTLPAPPGAAELQILDWSKPWPYLLFIGLPVVIIIVIIIAVSRPRRRR